MISFSFLFFLILFHPDISLVWSISLFGSTSSCLVPQYLNMGRRWIFSFFSHREMKLLLCSVYSFLLDLREYI